MSIAEDRELLELAAKAAGYAVDCAFEDSPLIYGEDAGPDGPREWNPLTDDGDALRLAVDLRLDISFLSGFKQVRCHCEQGRDNPWMHSVAGYGAGAGSLPTAENVRRAIVLAAAEIGRAMP